MPEEEPSIPETEEDPIPAVEPMDFRSEETAELCRQLALLARAGESPASIAVSAELVSRGDAAAGDLERLLQSGNGSVEAAAMRLLVRIGTPRSVAAALVRLCREPESDAQKKLVAAFGNTRSRAVADAVVDMLARETRPEGRRNLAAVVASWEGAEIVDVLAERIRGAGEGAGLGPWLDVLGQLSKPSNVPGLENLLLDDSRPEVHEAVAAALAKIGDRRACWLLASVGSELPACRQALSQIRSPYAPAVLREIAASDVDPTVRAAAQEALDRYVR